MTGEQKERVTRLYEMIANALPVQGRDYEMSISFDGEDPNPRVELTGKTDIGNLFTKYLYDTLPRIQNKESNQ